MKTVDIDLKSRAYCELAGLGLIIAGAVVQSELSAYFDFFGGSVSAAAVLLIVVGVVIFIIGFFGCCGAYKENYCMVMTFAVLLGIIFILEISAGIAAYVMRDQVKDIVSVKMSHSMKNYGKMDHDGVTRSWDTVQGDFKCCGVDEPDNWRKYNLNGTYPDSCCAEGYEDCVKETGDRKKKDLWKDKDGNHPGCIDGFVEWVKKNVYAVGGVGVGLAFIQIIGIILACCLARTIKKEYEVV